MRRFLLLTLLFAIPFTTGCATAGRNTEAGGLLGAALGAGTGAIIGHQTGDRGPGAAIGAGIGLLTGALIGNAMDASEEESVARTEQALHEVRRERAEQRRLSVLDVIRMSQAGISDDIIIAKIEESGSRFRLTASEIIDLERSSVSDRVIERMLRTGREYRVSAAEPAPRRKINRRTTYRIYREPAVPIQVHSGFWYCD